MPNLRRLDGSPLSWPELERLRQDYYARKRDADRALSGASRRYRTIRLTTAGRALLMEQRHATSTLPVTTSAAGVGQLVRYHMARANGVDHAVLQYRNAGEADWSSAQQTVCGLRTFTLVDDATGVWCRAECRQVSGMTVNGPDVK